MELLNEFFFVCALLLCTSIYLLVVPNHSTLSTVYSAVNYSKYRTVQYNTLE